MSRVYNDKLSERVNAQLARREKKVRIERRILVISGILFISLLILLGSGIHAFASSSSEPAEQHKYYTSVRVQSGDSVWTIADQFLLDSNMSKEQYVKEICEINNLSDGKIYAGEYLTVSYYSLEHK